MQVLSLGWEDTPEQEMATHSSVLAGKNPTDRGAWGAYSPCGHEESDVTGQMRTQFTELWEIKTVFQPADCVLCQ